MGAGDGLGGHGGMMGRAARRMTTRRSRFLIAIVLAAAVIALAAAARAIVPGWLRGTIERVAGQAIGRELKIAGAFELSISLTPTLTASDVTLANAPWGSEPFMVRAGRVKISIDLVSLWSRPLRIRDVTIDEVHVLLETSSQGRVTGRSRRRRRPARPPNPPPSPPSRSSEPPSAGSSWSSARAPARSRSGLASPRSTPGSIPPRK